MSKKYNYCVFICRCQPAHIAHIETIKRALELAENVIVIIGSANQARDPKNPFTWQERRRLLQAGTEYNPNISYYGVSNDLSNERWARKVQDTVNLSILSGMISTADKLPVDTVDERVAQKKVSIIGYEKDDTSFYLKMFPQWAFEPMKNIDNLHATDIRKQMFESGQIDKTVVPEEVYKQLQDFMKTEVYSDLVEEYTVISKNKRSWDWEATLNGFIDEMDEMEFSNATDVVIHLRDNYKVAPYAPIFATADAVVVQSGHVLVVKRKAAPGAGLLALPGGFVNQNETIRDAAIRELREETKLKVPEPVLKGSIKYEKVFDKPDRSLRGRTITQAFLFELEPGKLPKVKGGDDAAKAFWMPLSDVDKNQDQFFEDHYFIIQDMIGKL